MAKAVLKAGPVLVIDYRCEAEPGDAPFPEAHERFSLSYVRRGSFGCRALGRQFELVAGGFLVGAPGDEFTCTHDHHVCGDECLSIQLTPEALDSLGGAPDPWRRGALPPIAELALAGELAQGAAAGASDIALDEAGLWLVSRFLRLGQDGWSEDPGPVSGSARRTMVGVAAWMDENAAAEIDLAGAAAEAGLSAFHFLRTFKTVLGVTPHQHLVRSRLRHAARRLLEDDAPVTEIAFDVGFADLSNFVRSFGRAAGVSPTRYRARARRDRKNLQAAAWERGFPSSH